MEYFINSTRLSYHAEGERKFGEDKVVLRDDDDLTSGKTWSEKGYTVEQLFSPDEYKAFAAETYNLLVTRWKQSGLAPAEKFSLDQYHTLAVTKVQHLSAVDNTKLLSVNEFPGGIKKIEERISSVCGTGLNAKNPYDGQSVFHFRVIRPQSNDNNPLHRDVWLEDYASCINLYIPIAGSNDLSSLILIPESHHWPESKIERTVTGALINGIRFNVPAVTAINGVYDIERADPRENEVLIFSPYLIHGGAVNLNKNTTRISIELRLWKA
jgi:hypothetical protein